jgi:glutathione S-transferase
VTSLAAYRMPAFTRHDTDVQQGSISSMSLKLFELVGADTSRPFSPFCWRTRMALAHKGLSAETIPWCFTDKPAVAPYQSDKVPVLLDGETSVADSWKIANYLEDKYPDRPSLFGGEGGRAMGRMINWWGDVAVLGGVFPLIAADIPGHLKPEDSAYFRSSREARLGKPLEEAAAGRDKSVEGFRRSLDPMRLTLKTQPFLGGAASNYADYIVFGVFQWARVVSPFKLLADNDLIFAWREKLLDAFDGMARKSPGFPV